MDRQVLRGVLVETGVVLERVLLEDLLLGRLLLGAAGYEKCQHASVSVLHNTGAV